MKDMQLKLINGWEITKFNGRYMLSHNDVFIHGDSVAVTSNNTNNVWLNVFQHGSYIGSIWIDSPECIKELKKFIKATKTSLVTKASKTSLVTKASKTSLDKGD